MTADVVVSPLLRKELRALMPVVLATAAATLAGAMSQSESLMILATVVYPIGATALGAMAIGDEYAHGTIDQLLAQPVGRRRLVQTKLTALVLSLASLLPLAIASHWPLVAGLFLSSAHPGPMPDLTINALRVLLAPPLLGLCVAPWLTMLGRGPIAGTVFTLAVYVCWAVLTPPWLSDGGLRFYTREPDPWIFAALCIGSAVAGWRTFLRLECTGGRGGSLPMPSFLGKSAARPELAQRRRPVGALIGKELHLQHTAFIVAALYVLIWMAMPYFGYDRGNSHVQSLRGGLTMLFSGLLAVLTGSLASAEERAMGTLTWQIVQPYAMRKQWAIKALTAFALTLLLAVLLPSILDAIDGGGEIPLLGVLRAEGTVPVLLNPKPWWMVMVLLVLTAGGMFVSSLSTNSLVALLITPVIVLATMGAGAAAADWSELWTWRTLDLGTLMRAADHGMWGQHEAWWRVVWNVWRAAKPVAALVLLVVFTTLALRHHRSSRAGVATIARQIAWLVTGCSSAGFLIGAFWPALLWAVLTY